MLSKKSCFLQLIFTASIKLLENAHACCISEWIAKVGILTPTQIKPQLDVFVCAVSVESTASTLRCCVILRAGFTENHENLCILSLRTTKSLNFTSSQRHKPRICVDSLCWMNRSQIYSFSCCEHLEISDQTS